MTLAAAKSIPGQLLRASLSILVLVLMAGTSVAEPIVVLPMTTSSRSLAIYEKASASALARRLGEGLGQSVKAIATASDVGKDAKIIVDGRIVSAGEDRVKLEARIRRVATGKSIRTVATRSLPITDMDALVAELATTLQPWLERALTTRDVIVLPTAVVRGTRVASSEAPAKASPQVLLLTPQGSVAHGVVSVVEPATAGAFDMLARMDLRSAPSELAAGPDSLAVAAELKRSGADYALLVDVKNVRFSYQGVLSARGKVRLAMIGQDGYAVFDEVVRTHTVVGGRGDRHQAIIYRVVDQAFDMVLPQFRRIAEGLH